jgi:hypothetical protein
MAKKDSNRFTFGDFVIRLILALVLVLATYNPTSYSFIDWVRTSLNNEGLGAVHAFVGVVLLIGWVILFTATFNSLGGLGLGLGIAFVAALIWLLYDVGLLSGSGFAFYTWLALIGLSAILALGLCWAHVWRSLTGQLNVDEVDD